MKSLTCILAARRKGETEIYKIKNSLISLVRMQFKKTIPTLLIALAMVTMNSPTGKAAPTLPPGNTVEQWNKIAENTVVGSGAFQAEGFIYMADVSAARDDAAHSFVGG